MNFALSVLLLTAGAPLPPPRREEDTSRTDEVLPPFAPWPPVDVSAAAHTDTDRTAPPLANSVYSPLVAPDRPRNRRERREMDRARRRLENARCRYCGRPEHECRREVP